jgi:adenylylsulfate kinase-like enzyme
MKIKKGFWFCGLAGSGKTTAARYLKKILKQSILIDGDDVRKYISTDLGYSERDRAIQIGRLLGIATIAIKSNIIPIITSVYMDKETLFNCKRNKILVVEIDRDFKKIVKVRKIYKKSKNVVAKDIKKKKLKIPIIYNDELKAFQNEIKKLKKLN